MHLLPCRLRDLRLQMSFDKSFSPRIEGGPKDRLQTGPKQQADQRTVLKQDPNSRRAKGTVPMDHPVPVVHIDKAYEAAYNFFW